MRSNILTRLKCQPKKNNYTTINLFWLPFEKLIIFLNSVYQLGNTFGSFAFDCENIWRKNAAQSSEMSVNLNSFG